MSAAETASAAGSTAAPATAALDARVLLAHAANRSVEFVLSHGDERAAENTVRAYEALIKKRLNSAPVAYLTGRREFMGLDFEVDERVLIPRPETEILAEEAVAFVKKTGARRVLDLCAGSGCIGVSLAYYCENLFVTASDVSAGALEAARRNAERLGVADRIEFVESDLFESLYERHMGDTHYDPTYFRGVSADEKYGLIVSNPPYIPRAELSSLPASVKDWEPRLALDGGEDGLGFYRRIFA
ncbi:MAG: peptide chain release factor N(5)-glutamine methyltransferase, partial [Firmicutes bacterium]|nr:peptide chain release factor N(5)-glutamine methyltransferase [Bacillota bacterium]